MARLLQLNSPHSSALATERSSEENEAAKREAQKRDLQRQKGEETGDAGGPATDHHRSASHAGRRSTADCGVCLCRNSPKYD